MKYIDEDKLPIEIKNNELPKEETKKYKNFYEERIRTSGGFTDIIFISGVILVSFLWGMLVVILKGCLYEH